MKQLATPLLAAALALAALAPAPTVQAGDVREHRAMYVTPYLGDWPGGAITSATANTIRTNLTRRLDKLKACNINVLYFHVRSNCDAAYRSAYEPWHPGVSGTRGVEPYFDPLEVLLEEAHARGIEIYAWVNPYRYCGVYSHGESPLDYELTHPEWLLVQENKETILNPALEEVQQRICDVITDIISHYPVDGIIFDDYFYSNPTPYELDAEYYEAAKAADPNVGTQLEWRVNNINTLIGRVYDTIKSYDPSLVFGISPAGCASPPHVTSVYGLDPAPDYDWQYEAIASDPLQWYMSHHVDFMAPQIYWPDRFNSMQDWWAVAARKFQRHLYTAISLSSYNTYGGAEFDREVAYTRVNLADNEPGIGFFHLNTFNDGTVKVDGTRMTFAEYLGANSYAVPALTPLRPWNNEYNAVNVTNLQRSGAELTWDAIDNMRFTVYAFAEGEEAQPLATNLVQVRYTNSFTIPDELAGCTFGVCAYDHFGNEYPMTTEGATVGEAVVAKLTYPADGAEAAPMFDFCWEDNGSDNVVEVATDAAFTNIITMAPVHGCALSSFSMPELTEGTTYYWRVRTHAVNCQAGVSEVRSFVAGGIKVLAPSDDSQSLTPTITWTPAYEGSHYVVEVALDSKFAQIRYTGESDECQLTVPEDALYSGRKYYVRVQAVRNGRAATSDVSSFSTADITYDAPEFVNPQTAGVTIHSNQCVEIEPWIGMSGVSLQISETEDFPTRKSYRVTLKDGETASPELSEIKVASKALVDGQTYYVRVQAQYFTQATGANAQSSDYRVSSFVYSAEAGVSDIVADSAAVKLDGTTLLLPAAGCDVHVYTPAGLEVFTANRAPRTVDLSSLPSGLYIITVSGPTSATLKFAK